MSLDCLDMRRREIRTHGRLSLLDSDFEVCDQAAVVKTLLSSILYRVASSFALVSK